MTTEGMRPTAKIFTNCPAASFCLNEVGIGLDLRLAHAAIRQTRQDQGMHGARASLFHLALAVKDEASMPNQDVRDQDMSRLFSLMVWERRLRCKLF